MNNNQRAERARTGVTAYVEKYDDPKADSLDTWIGDLLADLRHLCKSEALNFDRLVERSIYNFEAEEDENEA